jgi:hypothetical protein
MSRRPGITFETATPPVPDTLPRMDVAAFVGFASRGPIDRPVPVEDVARFRDVFGPPLELVREVGSDRRRTAHLHRAVEAFFRNGGRRCWVVRVANDRAEAGRENGDAATSESVNRTVFPLPGVVSAGDGRPATVRARCFGATFDDLRVGTVLHRRRLPLPSDVRAETDGETELALAWSVDQDDLPADEDLEVGDLLRLRLEDPQANRFAKETAEIVYAPVAARTREPNGDEGRESVRAGPAYVFRRVPGPLAVSGESGGSLPETRRTGVEVEVQSASGPAGGRSAATLVRRIGDAYAEGDAPRFRLVAAPSEIPAGGEGSGLESQIVRVFDSSGDRLGHLRLGRAERSGRSEVEYEVRDALWTAGDGDLNTLASGDASVVRAEQVEFDVLAWRDRELQSRLDGLGFAASHPRAWTDLPVDEELFEIENGEAVSPEPGTLRADVFDPRFPLAAPATPGSGTAEAVKEAGADVFVPLGMAERPDADRTRGRMVAEQEPARLEKERLATFSTGVFVDDELAGSRTRTLQQKADDKVFLREEAADGLHSLWPIREVTLLAVPDAVHRGWESRPRWREPAHTPTPTFESVEVRADAETPYVRLAWDVDRLDEEGVEVQVQEAAEPTFEAPVTRYRGAEASVDRYVRDRPKTLYFRIRLLRDGHPSGWSETRRADVPDPEFTACTPPRLPHPDLRVYVDAEQRWWLQWDPLGDARASDVEYELQVGTQPALGAATTIAGPARSDGEGTFRRAPIPPGTEAPYDPDEGDVPDDRVWYELGRAETSPAVRYARIRARPASGEPSHTSRWTRTVPIVHTLRRERRVVSGDEYDDPGNDTPGDGRKGLRAVQGAMLRFAAAREDVLAVLSLPEEEQAEDARRHVTRLRTPGAVLASGEEQTLSYGALYYPWLLQPVDGGDRLVPTPPGGAAVGMIADQTLREGAWTAPANETLAAVRTVVPPPSPGDRADLSDRAVNVFSDESPDGILTLTASTLARDPDLASLPARRLLILVRRLALREGPDLVFENNTPLLRRRIAEQFDDLLRRLFERGAFAGTQPSEGYRVVTGAGINPPEQVERGRLVVELRVAPSRPAKFLTVRLVQRGSRTTAAGEAAAGETAAV